MSAELAPPPPGLPHLREPWLPPIQEGALQAARRDWSITRPKRCSHAVALCSSITHIEHAADSAETQLYVHFRTLPYRTQALSIKDMEHWAVAIPSAHWRHGRDGGDGQTDRQNRTQGECDYQDSTVCFGIHRSSCLCCMTIYHRRLTNQSDATNHTNICMREKRRENPAGVSVYPK